MRRLYSPECVLPFLLITLLIWGADLIESARSLADRLWDAAASVGRWWGLYF